MFEHFVFTEDHMKHGKDCSSCGKEINVGDLVHQRKGKRNPFYCEQCFKRFFETLRETTQTKDLSLLFAN